MCKTCVGISADSIIVLKHYSIYEYKMSCRKVENAKPRAADCCHTMEIIVDQSKIIKASAKFPPAFIERRKISTPEP